MKHAYIVLAVSALFACSPKIRTTVSSSRPPAERDATVFVIGIADPLPDGADELGTFNIGDSGVTTNCSYDKVIALAKERAQELGGNIIKLTEHRPPSAFGSSGHRIKGIICYESDPSNFNLSASCEDKVDSALYAEGCAAVYFYRDSGAGALIGYDVYANDDLLCRMTANSRDCYKLKALGPTKIWARTESRCEIEIDLQPGYNYYVRCGLTMGVMVGRPQLTLVSGETGKAEYERIKIKK